MAQIILDFGSGNTCKNDPAYIKRMIDALAEIDTHKHEVIIKWQLFTEPPASGGGTIESHDIPLTHEAFEYAYEYAKERGYKTTSSVFDKASLDFLLRFEVPFIKIACRPDKYWLIGEIPRRVMVYVSMDATSRQEEPLLAFGLQLWCVPKYPAQISDYLLHRPYFTSGVSDHVVGLGLWYKLDPEVWEKHYVLERDPANPDAGPFSVTPDQLKEIL